MIGVYEIADNNEIKPINYIKNGETLEITTDSLRKYIVSYKKLKVSNVAENTPNYKNKEKGYMLWLTIGSLAIIFIISGSIFKLKFHEFK